MGTLLPCPLVGQFRGVFHMVSSDFESQLPTVGTSS